MTSFRKLDDRGLQDVTVYLRMPTERRTILGRDVKVGDYESRIHLLVFDLERMLFIAPLKVWAEC